MQQKRKKKEYEWGRQSNSSSQERKAKPGITKIKKTEAKTLGSLSRKGDMQE